MYRWTATLETVVNRAETVLVSSHGTHQPWLPMRWVFLPSTRHWGNVTTESVMEAAGNAGLIRAGKTPPNRHTPVLSLRKPWKCVCVENNLTRASVCFVLKALGGELAYRVLKDSSHPMWGHLCSSTPSSRPFPDPSALSAPPPVTSSSSCSPVSQNTFDDCQSYQQEMLNKQV